MSTTYRAIDWNRQKRNYDLVMGVVVLLCLGVSAAVAFLVQPNLTVETVIIRASGATALGLLHVILAIGPLARLEPRFLPLLYNRRHLGVALFFLALVHGVFTTIQFHALGDEWPWISIWTAYGRDFGASADGSWALEHIPFEPFGVVALAIFFLMAATSHDFWLRNLGASIWKSLHLAVYVAYGLVLTHVLMGALQSERSGLLPLVLVLGFVSVALLHVTSAVREQRIDRKSGRATVDGYVDACAIDELREGRGRACVVGGRRVAVWMHSGAVYGTAGTCRHQGGPLAEGRIIDGCITCPWHGWNYRPEDGCSPPPFQEVIGTHDTRVIGGRVWVRVTENPLRGAGAAMRSRQPESGRDQICVEGSGDHA